jgi:hypothetical protein
VSPGLFPQEPDDVELPVAVAADVATLAGNVAALANDLFSNDGSGSSRTWTHT